MVMHLNKVELEWNILKEQLIHLTNRWRLSWKRFSSYWSMTALRQLSTDHQADFSLVMYLLASTWNDVIEYYNKAVAWCKNEAAWWWWTWMACFGFLLKCNNKKKLALLVIIILTVFVVNILLPIPCQIQIKRRKCDDKWHA